MIKYGISEVSVIPVRKEPNDRSEMITQLLFGESFQILEKVKKWTYIKITFDGCEGWIDTNNISVISEDLFTQINSCSLIVIPNLTKIIFNNKNVQIILPAGSNLPNFDKSKNEFRINNNIYQLSEKYDSENFDIDTLSKQFLNSPYLWGGKNPFGIDCSGFVQVVFKIIGIKLPRDANQQIHEGTDVNFISEVKKGDLAFFDNDEGNINHVGILLSNNEIIHASGKVRIDKFDQQGIYNHEFGKYTHKLRLIKRIL